MAFRNEVAFDTNFLIYAVQSKQDIFTQLEQLFGEKVSFVVPEQVDRELSKLSMKGGKLTKNIKLVRMLMQAKSVVKKKVVARNADAALLKLAKNGTLVATNDRELKRKINAASEKVAYLRQKSYIEIG